MGTSEAGTRARRKTPAERTAEIAAAAEELARSDGLAALTLRGIGDRLGVASSLVAHYESSMEDLVARTFRAIAMREVDEVAVVVGSAATPTDALRSLVDTVGDDSRDDVAALWADAWSIGRRNAALAGAARECMDAWQRLASGVVAAGVRSGEFPGADPEATGLLLFALVDATNAYALVGYRSPTERDHLLRRAVERAVAVPPGRLG